jgi:hypothetical protein
MQTRHGVFSHIRLCARGYCVSKHWFEQHVLHGIIFVLCAQHRCSHLWRGDLHSVLDLDSASDVPNGIRLHFLVSGGVPALAVFRADWAHDAHVVELHSVWTG